jgi:hypothetical protein
MQDQFSPIGHRLHGGIPQRSSLQCLVAQRVVGSPLGFDCFGDIFHRGGQPFAPIASACGLDTLWLGIAEALSFYRNRKWLQGFRGQIRGMLDQAVPLLNRQIKINETQHTCDLHQIDLLKPSGQQRFGATGSDSLQ